MGCEGGMGLRRGDPIAPFLASRERPPEGARDGDYVIFRRGLGARRAPPKRRPGP